jgi:choline kinase
LQVLRRLAKKNIGPRLLGTFNNGRFEEFFNAYTLTSRDLRVPETSRQIAKRMRELHAGIELLYEEREGGPSVFKNWDKWVERCEPVISWLDKEISDSSKRSKTSWRERGFVCGVHWPMFRDAVGEYRKWLTSQCGGIHEIKKRLVFAHNDTQYGNLLRLEPSDESPLLLPANEHKQLVVIDFEYASANTPGLEFANHFSEWCYNYHDPERPWACNTRDYPTPQEQHRFISAYVSHRSHLGGRPSASPLVSPDTPPSSTGAPGLTPFSIGAPAMTSKWPSYPEGENPPGDIVEADVQSLMREARLWRAANSAQWVAWGIVQAKVPAAEREILDPASVEGVEAETLSDQTEMDNTLEQVGEFDYLAYAQDRALFFWADMLSLGLFEDDQLPEELLGYVKAHRVNDTRLESHIKYP